MAELEVEPADEWHDLVVAEFLAVDEHSLVVHAVFQPETERHSVQLFRRFFLQRELGLDRH